MVPLQGCIRVTRRLLCRGLHNLNRVLGVHDSHRVSMMRNLRKNVSNHLGFYWRFHVAGLGLRIQALGLRAEGFRV